MLNECSAEVIVVLIVVAAFDLSALGKRVSAAKAMNQRTVTIPVALARCQADAV
jgi:hypothetical protein